MLDDYEIENIANKINVFAFVMAVMIMMTLYSSEQILTDLQHNLLYYPIIVIGLSVFSYITTPLITRVISPIMVRVYHRGNELPYGAEIGYSVLLKMRCKGIPFTVFVAFISCYLAMSPDLQYDGFIVIKILLSFTIAIVVLAVYNALALNSEMHKQFKNE